MGKGARIGAGLRGRLAFLPDFQLVLRFQFPENRGLLPPGAAQFPFRLRIKGLRCGQAFLLPPAGAEGPARQGIHQSSRHPGGRFRDGAVRNREIRAAAFQLPRQAAAGDSLANDKNVHDRWMKNRRNPEVRKNRGTVQPSSGRKNAPQGMEAPAELEKRPFYRAAMMASPISAVFTRISPGAPVARSPVRQPWSITRRTAASMASAAAFSPRE